MNSLPEWVWRSEARSEKLDSRLHAFAATFAPETPKTVLCEIMTRFGSDKGAGWHNYTRLYHQLFGDRRDAIRRVFELGLGTNNPKLESTMGEKGRPGASVRGWREYFPHADIYGGDIDRDILFADERIKTYFVDQTDKEAVDALWTQVGVKDFDIIIDDGLHKFAANRTFYLNSIDALAVDGVFIIEDIFMTDHTQKVFREFLDGVGKPAALISIPNPANRSDNCVAIVLGEEARA